MRVPGSANTLSRIPKSSDGMIAFIAKDVRDSPICNFIDSL